MQTAADMRTKNLCIFGEGILMNLQYALLHLLQCLGRTGFIHVCVCLYIYIFFCSYSYMICIFLLNPPCRKVAFQILGGERKRLPTNQHHTVHSFQVLNALCL